MRAVDGAVVCEDEEGTRIIRAGVENPDVSVPREISGWVPLESVEFSRSGWVDSAADIQTRSKKLRTRYIAECSRALITLLKDVLYHRYTILVTSDPYGLVRLPSKCPCESPGTNYRTNENQDTE